MDKDFLFSDKLCLDDTDFDFQDKSLTFAKSQSHKNRFIKTEKTLKNEENKRKQEINGESFS